MRIPLTPVRCLTRAADLFHEKVGVVCGEKRFTYGQMDERCRRLAAALKCAGVEPGDRVAFLSYNTHQLLEGYYGAPIIRAIVMPLNVRLTRPELTAIVAHAEPKILFYETEFASTVSLLRAGSPSLRTINLETEYEDFIRNGHPNPIDITSYDEDEIAELFYTSGSTGTPKGVTLSHRTLYLHALNSVGCMDLNHHGVELHTIPLFHANGWGRPQTATMMGIKQIMVRRFECPTVCRLIQDERATSLSIVPTMANALLSFEQRGDYDLSSLQQVFIGGAASSPALIKNLEKAFPCQILAGYGLTETCPVATSARRKSTVFYTSDEDRWERQSYAGWPIFGAEVRVVDPEMQPVPQDFSTVGEVVIRGDMVMDGYYREPEATVAVLTDGWLHTGDMGIWDKENYIQIVDRKKDIIISGGENISSIEIEKVIALHPSVSETAVVAAPDDKWGEIPVAFVVTKPNVALHESELGSWLTARLAKFKIPRRYIIQSEPLPKGGTGKILKKDLREPFWRERQRRVQG